jgi:hypothetical protein
MTPHATLPTERAPAHRILAQASVLASSYPTTPTRKAAILPVGLVDVKVVIWVSHVRKQITLCTSITLKVCIRAPSLTRTNVYSQTTLLIFTPILLLVVLMASVGLLNAVGGESLPSTLSLSVGAPNKRD